MYTDDIFYYSQLKNEALTWRLFTKENPTDPIAVGILPDTEFSVRIGHSYNEEPIDPFSLLGKLNVVSPQSLIKAATIFKAGVNVSDSLKEKSNTATELARTGLNKLGKVFNNSNLGDSMMEGGSLLAGKEFLSAFDLIKFYTGSSVDLDIPVLETYWVHGDSSKKTVKDRIKTLQSYLLGELKEFEGVFGLQSAPNGFMPSFNNLDPTKDYDNTFILKLGTMYEITNLIVMDFQYSLSMFNVMKKSGDSIVGSSDPTYATIKISVVPAAYISSARLKNIMKL